MLKKKREHTYTQAERKKIYKIKKQRVSSEKPIPKTAKQRSELIKEAYKEHPRVVFCPALNANVAINKTISSNKTRREASGSWKSTKLALMAPTLIEQAVLVYDNRSKNNVGQASFDAVFVLIAAIKGIGYAKITIGRYSPGVESIRAPYCQYCVSHLSIHTIKNK